MSARTRSGRRGQGGYVSVYFALIASLVLVPLVMLLIDVMTLAYYRTKLQSTADAVAIAAVAETSNWHIPIPTDWAGYIPYNGWLINGVHLKNLETSFGIWGYGTEAAPKEKLSQLARLSADEAGQQMSVKLGNAEVYPLGNFVSPFMWVRIPVEATDVKLHTPFLAQLLSKQGGGGNGTLTLKAEACAVVWYRVDRWAHRWWGSKRPDKDKDAVVKTLDAIINATDEPVKYYRLVNCPTGVADVVSLAESVITEHLNLHRGQVEKVFSPWQHLDPGAETILKEWGGEEESPSKEMKKAKDSLGQGEKKLPAECKQGTSCLESGSVDNWVDEAESDKKAEEEARKAAEAAARKAAEATAQQTDADSTQGEQVKS